MSTAGRPATEWATLRSHLTGDLVLPEDADYRRARRLALGQFDRIRPAAIAYCASPDDVRTCVLFAQDRGIHATPRSGGHSLAGWSTTEGLVIDLSRLAHVVAGPSTVHIGPGAQAVDVVALLARRGIQVTAGSDPSVGLAGYLLGGGNGWQTRKFGLGSDRMTSARVVLADGRLVRCSADEHPDLFWALRGCGGGNLGIVTDLEVRPTRVPRIVCFTLTWPWDSAARLAEEWQWWMMRGPVDLASTLVVLSLDSTGGTAPAVLVQGGYLGPHSALEPLVAELVSAVGRPPVTAVHRDLPYRAAMMRLFGCEGWTTARSHLVGHNPDAAIPRHRFVRDRSRMFGAPLSGTGLTDALAVFEADGPSGYFRALNFRALGGVANEPSPEATAYVHRDALFHTGYAAGFQTSNSPAEIGAAADAWVDDGFRVIDPHSNGRSYVNFPDPALPDPHRSYHGTNYPRLLAVQRRYDPGRFFRHAQSIGSRPADRPAGSPALA